MPDTLQFNPNWTSSPGDSMADILSRKQLTLLQFSEMIGTSVRIAKMLINGFITINQTLAERLNFSLGGSPEFWLEREKRYKITVDRLNKSEGERWLAELPLEYFKNYKKFVDADMLELCLEFFNVPDVSTWRKKYRDVSSTISFRKSTFLTSTSGSLTTWIREAEIQTEKLRCGDWNLTYFRLRLNDIKLLCTQINPRSFLLKIRAICAECGIRFTVLRAPEGCVAGSVVKFINTKRVLLIINLRCKLDDEFWFSFFHAAGHLLIDDPHEIFVDEEIENPRVDAKENKANELGIDILFSDVLRTELESMLLTRKAVMLMARKAGVSLGIVVGQLQRMGRIMPGDLNAFKRKFDFT